MTSVNNLVLIASVAVLSASAGATVLETNGVGVVGLGIDPISGDLWVGGDYDSNNDGVNDQIRLARYSTAGVSSASFAIDSRFKSIVGGTGVSTGGEAWVQGYWDANNDGTIDDRQGQRYNSAGTATLGFTLTSEPVGTLSRSAGLDDVNRPQAVSKHPVNNRWGILRYNLAGAADWGTSFDAGTVKYQEGIGTRRDNGAWIYVIQGIDTNADGNVDVYENGRVLRSDGSIVGSTGNVRFKTSHGIGVSPSNANLFSTFGAWDDDLDGTPESLRIVRWDISTGNIFGDIDMPSNVVAASGIGMSDNDHAWLVALINDGVQAPYYAVQRYDLNIGELEASFAIDDNFVVVPEPASVALCLLPGLLYASRRTRKWRM